MAVAGRLTPDQLAKKVRPFLSHHPYDAARKADAALADLLALAKQGEAYEAALAHAQSLYRDRETEFSGVAQSEAIAHLHGALEAGIGHVPVEAFAAAMTALEQAEKERDKVRRDWNTAAGVALRRIEAAEAERDHLASVYREGHVPVESLAACQVRVHELENALACIGRNAESWHGDDAAKGRALTVIAGWARDPASIPPSVLAAVLASGEPQ